MLAKDVTTEPARFAEYVAEHPLDVLKITPNHFMALVAGKQGAELAALAAAQVDRARRRGAAPGRARTLLGARTLPRAQPLRPDGDDRRRAARSR